MKVPDKINSILAIVTAGIFIVSVYSTCLTKEAIVSSDSTNEKYLDKFQQLANATATADSINELGYNASELARLNDNLNNIQDLT